jgi:hypothetical protein
MTVGVGGDNRRGRILRRLTSLVAAVFVLLAVIVPALHSHLAATAFSRSAASPSLTTAPDSPASGERFHAAPVLHDCSLCEWLIGASHSAVPPTPAAVLLASVSWAALLLIAARFAALCARPAPRRGLRAPPTIVFVA